MIRLLAAVSAALVLSGCSQKPPPSVLFVTFDTTRYDHIGADGDSEAKTPTIDAIASQGLLFEHAYASAPLTLPSHTTIFTGREPIEHGVHNNGKFRVPDEAVTLAELVRQAGYDTAAIVSAFVLDERYNLGQGFAHYDDDVHTRSGPLNMTVPQRPANEVADAAMGWLEKRDATKPFFLWTHFYDPHHPLEPPAPFKDELPSKYAAEIAFADSQLARVLEKARAAAGDRGLLIVFTADHGESLGEHEEHTHGILAYDGTLHVPLILAGPGVPSGERSEVLARHVDLLPTVLARLGIDAPPKLGGRDLVANRDVADEEALGYFESRGGHFDLGWSVIEGVRNERWKYTANPAPAELYDIRSDPRESVNLIDEEPEAAREMLARWQRYRESVEQAGDARIENASLEASEQLAALGYVQAPQEFDPSDIPDPRRFVRIHSWIEDARRIAQAGQYAQAVELLETMRESKSVKALVLRMLAPIYGEMGRFEDSLRAFDEYVQLTGADEAKLGRARLLLNLKRSEEALQALEGLEAKSPMVITYRAYALARLGRLAEARQVVEGDPSRSPAMRSRRRLWASVILDVAPIPTGEAELRRVHGEDPKDPVVRSRLGYYLAVWGKKEQSEEALDLLRSAADEAKQDPEVLASFGWGAYKLGDDELAIEWLTKALAIDPRRQLERFRVAYPLRRKGEREKARQAVATALAGQPGATWAPAARELLAEVEAELARSPKAAQQPGGEPRG